VTNTEKHHAVAQRTKTSGKRAAPNREVIEREPVSDGDQGEPSGHPHSDRYRTETAHHPETTKE
jgi:hypothetical protein